MNLFDGFRPYVDGLDQQKSTISFYIESNLLDAVDKVCKLNNIPRSMFIRESLKNSLDLMNKEVEKSYIYVVHVDRLNYYKIGKTKNPERRIEVDLGAKIPCEVNTIHLFETYNANLVERYLHNMFISKRIGDTEFFDLKSADVQWFKDEGYREIPEIANTLPVRYRRSV